jgi:energy-converting hydrogenase Eha subunit C
MRLNAPSQALWLISVILGAIGIIAHPQVLRIQGVYPYAFWLLAIGFILLVVATLVRRA